MFLVIDSSVFGCWKFSGCNLITDMRQSRLQSLLTGRTTEMAERLILAQTVLAAPLA